MRDNRIFRTTRLLAVIITPFLLAAFYILYLRTSETKTLFAWDIQAPMTAMMLGAAYLGGAYFFVRAALAPAWQRICAGFLPVTTFASMMGIATLLHWDRFEHGNLSFYTWVVVYLTTPFLVLLAWVRNRRTDPKTPEAGDFVLVVRRRPSRSVVARAKLKSVSMKQLIMNRITIVMCVATSALALSFLLVGCDREVSNTKSSSENKDGTVKSTEKTVTQSPDGTTTKTEETKKTTPPDKP